MALLNRSFYARNTLQVAQDLLGKIIVRIVNNKKISGMIVETEAYEYGDEASHAYNKQTKRNQALFGPSGHAYIYSIHNHYCLNLVSHDKQTLAGGVLIRALEPLQGIDTMEKNRHTVSLRNLTNGPGKLCKAFAITKELYGHDVTHKGPLYVIDNKHDKNLSIISSPRIGISKAKEKMWRFYIADNKWVSKK